MKMINIENTKYELNTTNKFDKQLKKVFRQGKDIERLILVVEKLANGEELDSKYKNHKLVDDKTYKDCYECHVEPDWLLIYKIKDNELILLLFATGSYSDLFN